MPLTKRQREALTEIERRFGTAPFYGVHIPSLHWRTSDALIDAGYLEVVSGPGVRCDEDGHAPLRRTAKAIE